MSKAELREFVAKAVAEFLANGGEITVYQPGVAQGSGFRRNTSPFGGLMGVDKESPYC